MSECSYHNMNLDMYAHLSYAYIFSKMFLILLVHVFLIALSNGSI